MEGERINFEALTALTIRICSFAAHWGREIPFDFFFNLYSGGNLAINLAGDIFREVGARVSKFRIRVDSICFRGKGLLRLLLTL